MITPNTNHYFGVIDIRLLVQVSHTYAWYFAIKIALMIIINSKNPFQKRLIFVAFKQHFWQAKLSSNVSWLQFIWHPISLLLNTYIRMLYFLLFEMGARVNLKGSASSACVWQSSSSHYASSSSSSSLFGHPECFLCFF